MESASHRRIRSYVLRQGRITTSQQRALQRLMPLYGLDPQQPLVPERVFGRQAPLVLEIGFGDGEALAEAAAAHPDQDFLGIEVHPPGVGHLLLKIESLALRNVRVWRADAVDILSTLIPEQSLDAIRVFFPDPWHKKKHHKRRLIDADFVRLAASRLKPGGIIHTATDWADYAQHMRSALESCPPLRNASPSGFSPRSDHRPMTKFERRGQRLGHSVWDLIFVRIAT